MSIMPIVSLYKFMENNILLAFLKQKYNIDKHSQLSQKGDTMPRIKSSKLSDIEFMLLMICMEKGEIPASDVWKEVSKTKDISYNAVKIEIDRIADKGYLSKRKIGPLWVYKPETPKDAVLSEVFERIISTVLHNEILPIFTHFCKNRGISEKNKAEIIRIMDECGKKNKKT